MKIEHELNSVCVCVSFREGKKRTLKINFSSIAFYYTRHYSFAI